MFAYRFLLSLAAPVVIARLLWRVLRGHETLHDLLQRLGGGTPTKPPLIWLHGASNGELTSARALLSQLLDHAPDLQCLVTTNTTTARAMVMGWHHPRITARLAPLDLRWVLWRFWRCHPATALIIVENELWPNRIASCVKRSVPVAVIGARLSAKSARTWGRMRGLARQIYGALAFVSAQDSASHARFAALGVAANRLGPVANLKAGLGGTTAPPACPELADFGARPNTVLAASTHEGEDATVITAFAKAHQANPALRLIIAPRHPRRLPQIEALLRAQALPYAVRSRAQVPGADTVIYVADTMGEMALWYHWAGVTFVGGSLVPVGGHTPYEPMNAGSAVLHGPEVANFTDSYAALDQAGAARCVPDGKTLAQALLDLTDETTQTAMAQRARACLAPTLTHGTLTAKLADLIARS